MPTALNSEQQKQLKTILAGYLIIPEPTPAIAECFLAYCLKTLLPAKHSTASGLPIVEINLKRFGDLMNVINRQLPEESPHRALLKERARNYCMRSKLFIEAVRETDVDSAAKLALCASTLPPTQKDLVTIFYAMHGITEENVSLARLSAQARSIRELTDEVRTNGDTELYQALRRQRGVLHTLARERQQAHLEKLREAEFYYTKARAYQAFEQLIALSEETLGQPPRSIKLIMKAQCAELTDADRARFERLGNAEAFYAALLLPAAIELIKAVTRLADSQHQAIECIDQILSSCTHPDSPTNVARDDTTEYHLEALLSHAERTKQRLVKTLRTDKQEVAFQVLLNTTSELSKCIADESAVLRTSPITREQIEVSYTKISSLFEAASAAAKAPLFDRAFRAARADEWTAITEVINTADQLTAALASDQDQRATCGFSFASEATRSGAVVRLLNQEERADDDSALRAGRRGWR